MSDIQREIINKLTRRREQLGMSDYNIAARSGVSQPTVYRILSGKNKNPGFDNLLAITAALGFCIDIPQEWSVEEIREQQAEKKARQIVNMTQATSALEGQGLDEETLESAKARIKQRFLAGSAKDLWAE